MGSKIERECPVCKSTYIADAIRLSHGRQTTCSRKCSYLHRAAIADKSETVTCSMCGAAFRRCPSHRKARHDGEYCSRACHYKGRSAGLTKRIVATRYDLSAETRARQSARSARMYAAGEAFPIPDTEKAVSNALRSLGIEHHHQYVIDLGRRSVSVDLFFAERRIVVEIDERSLHKKLRAKDIDRDRDLQAAGYTVKRVHDDRDPDAILRRVLDAIA